uniref:HAT C-terminal dimerisation domain-containing protein n=1 Tax=Ditylenchus dipsaci TaxID=166011 RepID=A0A915EMD2_9BILA
MRLEVLLEKRDLAKRLLRKLVKEYNRETAEDTTNVRLEQPSPFGFGVVKVAQSSKESVAEQQISNFFKEIEGTLAIGDDVIQFWVERSTAYPTLANIALNVLSIPASTAAVERFFSITSMHTAARKSRTGHALLKSRSILTYNSNLIEM